MVRKRVQTHLKEIESIAAYARVSTEEQAKSGLGIDAQKTRCAGMAMAKGWPEPVFYIDEGISGTKDARHRPELKRMLENLRAGKHQAVIILSLDRIGRESRLILDLVDEIGTHAILVSCKESLDTETPTGQFVLTIFAAMAQLERDLIAERTRAALAELSARTGDAGGKIPYGYIRVPGGVKIETQQARVVRRIYALRQQKEALRTIADTLNKANLPGPRGGKWFHTSVKEILKHQDTYRGGQRGKSQFKWPVILKEVA